MKLPGSHAIFPRSRRRKEGKRSHWEFHFKPFASWIWIKKAVSKESTNLLCEILCFEPRLVPQPPSTCKIASINSHNYLFSFMRICSAVAAAFLRRKHNKVTEFKVLSGRALYLHFTDDDDVTADMWRETLTGIFTFWVIHSSVMGSIKVFTYGSSVVSGKRRKKSGKKFPINFNLAPSSLIIDVVRGREWTERFSNYLRSYQIDLIFCFYSPCRAWWKNCSRV